MKSSVKTVTKCFLDAIIYGNFVAVGLYTSLRKQYVVWIRPKCIPVPTLVGNPKGSHGKQPVRGP